MTSKITAKMMRDAAKVVEDHNFCRDVYRDKRMHVVEYKPQIRVFKFNLKRQHSMHYLAVPYMQFTRYLGEAGLSLHVSFTNEPLDNIKQEVYFPPFPNVWWPSLQVCLMHCPGPSFDQVMKDFWNTRYLDCEDWYCFPVLDRELPMRTYHKWEKMSKEDPTFILDVKWTHPACIQSIPDYDHHGSKRFGVSANPIYGHNPTNRADGPIRSFAVVPYGRGGCQHNMILD